MRGYYVHSTGMQIIDESDCNHWQHPAQLIKKNRSHSRRLCQWSCPTAYKSRAQHWPNVQCGNMSHWVSTEGCSNSKIIMKSHKFRISLGLLLICHVGFVSIVIDGIGSGSGHNESGWKFSTQNSTEFPQVTNGIERLRSHLWWLRKLCESCAEQFSTKVSSDARWQQVNIADWKIVFYILCRVGILMTRWSMATVAKRMESWNCSVMCRRQRKRNVVVRKPVAIVSWEWDNAQSEHYTLFS